MHTASEPHQRNEKYQRPDENLANEQMKYESITDVVTERARPRARECLQKLQRFLSNENKAVNSIQQQQQHHEILDKMSAGNCIRKIVVSEQQLTASQLVAYIVNCTRSLALFFFHFFGVSICSHIYREFIGFVCEARLAAQWQTNRIGQ